MQTIPTTWQEYATRGWATPRGISRKATRCRLCNQITRPGSGREWTIGAPGDLRGAVVITLCERDSRDFDTLNQTAKR